MSSLKHTPGSPDPRRFRMAGLLAPFLVLAHAAPGHAGDDMLARALARSSANTTSEWAFERHVSVTSSGRQHSNATEHWRPGGGGRDEALIDYRDLADLVGADARLKRRGVDHAVYAVRVTSLPPLRVRSGDNETIIDGDWSEHPLVGELTTRLDEQGEPYVATLELRLEKAFGNPIARVRKIEMQYRFEPAMQDGRMLTTGFQTEVAMRNLLFFGKQVKVDVVHTGFEPVPAVTVKAGQASG